MFSIIYWCLFSQFKYKKTIIGVQCIVLIPCRAPPLMGLPGIEWSASSILQYECGFWVKSFDPHFTFYFRFLIKFDQGVIMNFHFSETVLCPVFYFPEQAIVKSSFGIQCLLSLSLFIHFHFHAPVSLLTFTLSRGWSTSTTPRFRENNSEFQHQIAISTNSFLLSFFQNKTSRKRNVGLIHDKDFFLLVCNMVLC